MFFMKSLRIMISPDRLSPTQAEKRMEEYSRTMAWKQGSFSYGLRGLARIEKGKKTVVVGSGSGEMVFFQKIRS
jgi:hypothetical protein